MFTGPNIITDGLVLYLDAANKKSLADVPATNLNTYSEDFTQGAYNQVSVSKNVNSDITPFNNTNSTLVSRVSTTANSYITKFVIPSPTQRQYTLSVYAKLGTVSTNFGLRCQGSYPDRGDALFNLSTGTLIGVANGGANTSTTGTILSVGNGWYRCSVTTNFPVATPNIYFVCSPTSLNSITGFEGQDGALSNCYIYGVQLETGPTATTYIPTTSTIASRVPPWSDVSRRGNTGTLINGPTYDSSNGGSLVFDGIDDYVSVPSLANTAFPQDTGTISIWYNIDSGSALGSPIFDGFDNSKDHIFIRRGSSFVLQVAFNYNILPTSYVYVSNHNISMNAWHNIAVTYVTGTSSQVKVYIDGVLVNTGTISYSDWRPSGQFVGFGMTAGNSGKGKGSIIKIYNKALTGQEVLQNYNATKSRFNL